jgi:hypothetical protein
VIHPNYWPPGSNDPLNPYDAVLLKLSEPVDLAPIAINRDPAIPDGSSPVTYAECQFPKLFTVYTFLRPLMCVFGH